jgi:HTH-type transcriptional repressor of NAD biosynthesis genes
MGERRFGIGMFGGKFMPYHLGHLYCLETASRMCGEVFQILMTGCAQEESILKQASGSSAELLDPAYRFRIMKAAGDRLGNVRTICLDISRCRTPEGEEDWDAETPLVLEACGHFDAVFSSEVSYGAYFSRAYPWAEHVLVDPPRIVVPISGTMVRTMEIERAKQWLPE